LHLRKTRYDTAVVADKYIGTNVNKYPLPNPQVQVQVQVLKICTRVLVKYKYYITALHLCNPTLRLIRLI